MDSIQLIKNQLQTNQKLYLLFQQQVNKDLARAGINTITTDNLEQFLYSLTQLLEHTFSTHTERFITLMYLADVSEQQIRNHGEIIAFVKREWDKVNYRFLHSQDK